MVLIGINGFGRIGRLSLRAALAHPDVDVAAINDPFIDAAHMAYLFKHDTVHGEYQGNVRAEGPRLHVDGKIINVYSCKDPTTIPWGALNIDIVIEASGVYTTIDRAEAHLVGGAKRIIISAPSADAPAIIMGVNEDKFRPEHTVISNGSCTTNCLAPLVKIVHEKYGIVEGVVTTVHAATGAQKVVDAPTAKDWRDGRSVFNNIIPGATGAAKAVTKMIPDLQGKLTGMAYRVPSPDVSVVDIVCRLETEATKEEIDEHIYAESKKLPGILAVCDEPCVSSDFRGNSHSCVYDPVASLSLNSRFVKLVAWYDNEWGYSHRLIDLAAYVHKKSDPHLQKLLTY